MMNERMRIQEEAVFPMTDAIRLLLMRAFHFRIKMDRNKIFLLMMSKAVKVMRKCKLIIQLLRLSHPKSPVVLPVICAELLWGQKLSFLKCYVCNKQMHSIEQCGIELDLTDSSLITSSPFKNNSFTSEDTKQFILCFKCQGEMPNDLQNNVGSSEAEQIISQTPLKKKLGQKNWRKSETRIKAMMTLP